MTTLNQVSQNQLQKEVTINENFTATAVAGIFANRGNQTGLNYNYYGGYYQKQDGTQGSIADGSIALTNNTTNYVYFDIQNEVMGVSTTAVPNNCFPVAQIITAGGVITSITDTRVVALYANGTPTNLSYTLPIASTTQLGGIMVDGVTCSVSPTGVLSVAGGGLTIAKTTATQQSTTTTLANITQLVAPVVANSVYEVECFVIFQSAATTTGLRLGFTSPTGSIGCLDITVPITGTTSSTHLQVTFPNNNGGIDYIDNGFITGTGVGTINTNLTAKIGGLLQTGANPGNFQIQFSSEVAASAVTVQIGSILKVKKIA